MKPSLVIVEDNAIIALDMQMLCEDAGWHVLAVAGSLPEAKEWFHDLAPDALVTDMELGNCAEADGVDVLDWLRDVTPDVRAVFTSGTERPDLVERIFSRAPDAFLHKPVRPPEIEETLGQIAADLGVDADAPSMR